MGCCQNSQTETPLVRKADFVKTRQGTFQNSYEIIETLGRGAFGTVSKVRERKTNLIRAMKEIKKTEATIGLPQIVLNEVDLLIQLDHPNVMKIYEVIESSRSFYIVCECLTGGELFEILKKKRHFSEEEVCKYMLDVFTALAYLHSEKVVHSDLKLENLVLESKEPGSRVKLIDFGVSRRLLEGSLQGKVGSYPYMAPEILKGTYNEKIDIWSAGIIMHLMLSGTMPFKFENEEQFLKLISSPQLPMNKGAWVHVSEECKDLIIKLLNPDPVKRITASRALKHRWLKQQVENTMSSIQTSFCDNFKKFKGYSKVVSSILIYISSQMLTNQEESPLGQMFRALDADNNGHLSKEELLRTNSTFKFFTVEEVDEIFENCDLDKSGCIDYSEFLTATMGWGQLFCKEKVQMIFNYFDSEKCGKLSLSDLKSNFSNVTEAEWKEFLAEVDTNKDGGISLEELKDYLVKILSN